MINISKLLENKHTTTKISILKELNLYEDMLKSTQNTFDIKTKILLYVKNGGDLCKICGIETLDKTRIRALKCMSCSLISGSKQRASTNLEKYGTANVFSSNLVKLKIHSTKVDRYGDDYYKVAAKKSMNTNTAKYGVAHNLQRRDVYDKVLATHMSRYGVEHSQQNISVKQKTRETMSLKGRDYYKTRNKKTMLNRMTVSEAYWANNIDKLYDKYVSESHTILGLSSVVSISHNTIGGWFRRAGYEIFHRTTSLGQKNLTEAIRLLGVEVVENDRKIIAPQEIDIWIPSNRLGIEYNGAYWHADDKMRHIEKYRKAVLNSVRLLQFWDFEVESKRDIVMSMIASRLKITTKIFARKCLIKEISAAKYSSFCEANHLQGSAGASIKLGLFYQDELVSIMSFGKSRFDKKHQWEMIRFCSKLGFTVVGGASKLWKHFTKNWDPASVVSYADARISEGKIYEKLGFEFTHHAEPNYWYTKNFIDIESRIKYQKHKLKNLLEKFDETLTEDENMKNNRFAKLYDAGNLVFSWISNNR